MGIWILGSGRRERDPGRYQTHVGVVNFAVAASVTLPEHANLAPAEVRSEHYNGQPDVLDRPGRRQPTNWTVFRCRSGWPIFQRLHSPHAATATIHRTNRGRAYVRSA